VLFLKKLSPIIPMPTSFFISFGFFACEGQEKKDNLTAPRYPFTNGKNLFVSAREQNRERPCNGMFFSVHTKKREEMQPKTVSLFFKK